MGDSVGVGVSVGDGVGVKMGSDGNQELGPKICHAIL
jgi:hypothetical protein